MHWSALIVREGVWTVDDCLVRPGATVWDVPVPLVDLAGVRAGTITRVWRVGDDLWAQGDQTTGTVPVDYNGRPNWQPAADLDAVAFHTVTHRRPSRRFWPWPRTEYPGLVLTAARLRGAYMFPADRAAWPGLSIRYAS